jgi:outer membrane protein assembly factor BamB
MRGITLTAGTSPDASRERRIAPAALVCAAAVLICGADWRQFRGTYTTGVAEGPAPPVTWGVDESGELVNVAWSAALPGRGVSGPIVVGGRVVVTCSSGYTQNQLRYEDRLHVLCFDAGTGEALWHRQFWATGRTLCHPTSSVAAPTPASDGERVFAFFSSNDLVCLDLEGNLLWFRGLTHDFPTAANDVGMAASPVVSGGVVVVQVESKGTSFAAGIDALSGETRWSVPRESAMNWTSPALLSRGADEPDLVVLQSPSRLSVHEIDSGDIVWSYDAGCSTIPSPVAAEGTVFAPTSGLTALRMVPGSSTPEVAWQENRLAPSEAGAVVHAGRVYTLNSVGVASAADAESGEVIWTRRLQGHFWAMPIVCEDRMYLVNDQGLGQVIDLAHDGEVLGEGALRHAVYGSPAIADAGLYIRSESHLWKVASP